MTFGSRSQEVSGTPASGESETERLKRLREQHEAYDSKSFGFMVSSALSFIAGEAEGLPRAGKIAARTAAVVFGGLAAKIALDPQWKQISEEIDQIEQRQAEARAAQGEISIHDILMLGPRIDAAYDLVAAGGASSVHIPLTQLGEGAGITVGYLPPRPDKQA